MSQESVYIWAPESMYIGILEDIILPSVLRRYLWKPTQGLGVQFCRSSHGGRVSHNSVTYMYIQLRA